MPPLARRILPLSMACAALTGCMPSHRMTPELAPGRACPGPDGHAWYFPEEASDNERLEDWCATTGPPVVMPEPVAPFPGLAPGDELEVLSWNVAAGGGDVLRFLRSETELECAGPESALPSEASHFALLVQEAFRRSADLPKVADERLVARAATEERRPGERLDVVEVAERCGLSLVYVAAARNGLPEPGELPEDRGVAVLSTLPLTDVLFIELPYESARRVALVATVRDTAGRGVRLANLHFISASTPSRMLVTGNGSRLRQGLAVADVLGQAEEAKGDPQLSTLVAGDFNTWSQDETTLRRLRDLFPDLPLLDLPTRGAFPTDHMLFGTGTGAAPIALRPTYVRVGHRYHSDHHAVRVRIRFPE